jgi:hypothetical protein
LVLGYPYGKMKHATVDASATAVVDSGPLAANADDVSRFNDETAIDSVDTQTVRAGINVRKTPPTGDVVAVLAKGVTVTQIAQRDKFFLITFDNPKDSSERLMGWVINTAFNATAPVATGSSKVPTKKCPTGQDSIVGQGCKRTCKDDSFCNDDESCSGKGTLEGTTTVEQFCVSDNPPPPPPPPPVVDAGGGGGSGGRDAGGGGGGGGGGIISNPPCTGTTALATDGKCHKTCNTSVTECPGTAFCIKNKAAAGGKICSVTRSL